MSEKKHLFGSSEKSDFILNMTTKSTQKLCGIYSMIAIIVLTVIEIPYYLTQHVVNYVENNVTHYVGELFSFYISTVCIAAGLVGFLIFLVAHMKNEVKISDNRLLAVVAVIIAVSVWATFASTSLDYAFFGYLDRSEGLLTLLAYWGYFAVGMTLTSENWRVKFSDFIVGIGAFNALVGILQAIPAFYDIIPNTFKDLFLRMGTTAGEGELVIEGQGIFEKGYASTGFLCTPYALCAVMTLTFAFALAGVMYDKSKKRKYFYEVAALMCAAASMLSKVLPGIIGIGAVAVVMLVIEVVRLCSRKDSKLHIALWAVVTVLTGVMACALFATNTTQLRDEQIIFTDTYYRLSVSANNRASKSDQWIYPYLWDDGMYLVEQNMLTGVGPDNWGEMSSSGSSIDRAYNEYIDVASQRGILCLAFYVIFLGITIIKMFSALKKFICQKEEFGWVAAAVFSGAIAYLVQAFFNISSNYSSPYFWIIMGIGWSYFAVKKTQNKI